MNKGVRGKLTIGGVEIPILSWERPSPVPCCYILVRPHSPTTYFVDIGDVVRMVLGVGLVRRPTLDPSPAKAKRFQHRPAAEFVARLEGFDVQAVPL